MGGLDPLGDFRRPFLRLGATPVVLQRRHLLMQSVRCVCGVGIYTPLLRRDETELQELLTCSSQAPAGALSGRWTRIVHRLLAKLRISNDCWPSGRSRAAAASAAISSQTAARLAI